MPYFEVSAKDNKNVGLAFVDMAIKSQEEKNKQELTKEPPKEKVEKS